MGFIALALMETAMIKFKWNFDQGNLEARGVHVGYITGIKDMHDRVKIWVKTVGENSDGYGMHQGSTLSFFLNLLLW